MKVLTITQAGSSLVRGDRLLEIDGQSCSDSSVRELLENQRYDAVREVKIERLGKELIVHTAEGLAGISIELEEGNQLLFPSQQRDGIDDYAGNPAISTDLYSEQHSSATEPTIKPSTNVRRRTRRRIATSYEVDTEYALSRKFLTLVGVLEVIAVIVIAVFLVGTYEGLGLLFSAVVLGFIWALSFVVRQVMKSMLDLSDTNREILYELRANAAEGQGK